MSCTGLGNLGPALADTTAAPGALAAPIVAQAATAATLVGSVRDQTGGPVVGAHVKVTGATSATATTDGKGNFTVSVPAGLYSITIERGGYNPVDLTDFAAAAGTTTPVNVTMNQVNLSSLRTIGSVTTTTRGGSINTGPATTTVLTGQAFADLPSPQINSVIEHSPDVTVQHMGTQPDTTIVVGGVQPYETQVLIDGHPIALGQFGTWQSQYFPSYLIGAFETQVGPGNTTPFANLAVGGTANIETSGFTKATKASLTYGVDNYASQYSNLNASGSFGNFEYVVDLGTAGQNSPLTGTQQYLVSPAGDGTAIINTQMSGNGDFYNQAELFKLKYDFTPTTSLDVGFVGAWGGYNPQGSAWATYYGPEKVVSCIGNPTTSTDCGNPKFDYLVGQTVNGYSWYPGSAIYNNQNLYDATLRTSLGNTTILIRPYIADIAPENNVLTTNGPQQSYTVSYGGYGSGQFPNGTPVTVASTPAGYTLTGNGVTVPANAAASSCLSSFYNVTNPAGQYVVAGNNQAACYDSPYVTYEQDKLYGATTSILQPIGNSLLNFTYDFHGESTFAYIGTPAGVTVPFTAVRFSTLSLTGTLNFIKNLAVNFGMYDTTWTISGSQPELVDGAPVDNASGSEVLQALGRSITKFDPKIAFVYHPEAALAIRAATGGATTFPFAAQVSGLGAYEPPAVSLGLPYGGGGTLTEKNPNLNPEVSWAYSLGADYRFSNSSVLSLDGVDTVIHGVFENLVSGVPFGTSTGCTFEGLPCEEGLIYPFNEAELNSKTLTLKYNYAPPVGFGFNLSAATSSVIVTGIVPSQLTAGSATLPADGVQICGNGQTIGISTCIPYLQGYGQFTYAFKDGAFAGLGTQYFGKNNSYFQPPFAQVDLVLRKPVRKYMTFQLSVQNLLNTNTYGTPAVISGQGVPLVADTTNAAKTAVLQTTYAALDENPAPPRTIRLSLTIHN